MATYHRKLLQEHISNQTTTPCSDCHPTCPYDCDYVSIYWQPEPPQIPPPSSINNNTPNHMSPSLIIIVSLVASFILFVSYYIIIIRYCTRFRQQPTTQRNQDTQDFMNHDQQPELDHPIWNITTIGLQPSVINSIKVVKFTKVDGMIEKGTCSVCLSEFEHHESLRLLPKCNHLFHIRCIDTWLLSHKTCPLCRAAVVSQSNDQNLTMEDAGNDGEIGLNGVLDSENREDMREMRNVEGVQELKTEHETVITLRRSISMDFTAEIGSTDTNFTNPSTALLNLNDIRDSRTRRMMIMRSFSYSERLNL